MVINNILEKIFSAPSNVTLLRALNERTIGISGREAARITGLSLRTVQVSLSNLENTGVVKRFAGNREHLFIFNRKNYLAKNLLDNLFIAETKYRQDVFKIIKLKLKNASHSIILFGSAARGSDNLKSDLDICLVYKPPKNKIEELVADLRTELSAVFSISFAPFYLTAAQFKEYGLNKKPLVNNIINDGKIICGKSFKELLDG